MHVREEQPEAQPFIWLGFFLPARSSAGQDEKKPGHRQMNRVWDVA
jgi:hypothetical protein